MALSTPNTMVNEYFSFLRKLAIQAQDAKSEAEERQYSAACIIMSVTVVEIFLNLYIPIY